MSTSHFPTLILALFLIFSGNIKTDAQSPECINRHPYRISGINFDADDEGKTIYLMLCENNAVIDSAIVKDGAFLFEGNVPKSSWARIDIGRQYACLIAGEGDVVVDFNTHRPASGNEINMAYNSAEQDFNLISEHFRASADSLGNSDIPAMEKQRRFKELIAIFITKVTPNLQKAIYENNDNGAGHALTVLYYNVIDGDPQKWTELYSGLSDFLKNNRQINEINNKVMASVATKEGNMFVDLTGQTIDGKEAKLSDFVGKGKYVLVDFWASWCGPCITEATETLIPLHKKYVGSDNFMILGAATWDNNTKTLQAIEKHGYGWNHIIGLGMTPMDTYGFDGIPMIMLFDPEGRIIFRNLRGADIIDQVEKVAHLPNNG